MGQVYLAEQLSLKRKVALKLLKPHLAAEETALRRFRTEAEAVARATHANIVQVYAIGECDGLNFMALEYVEGLNLRDYMVKKGLPSLSLAISVMRQIASALARAGELGIVHRDIKPENILLTRKGEVKVADFGLSRCFAGEGEAQHLTQTGVAMGTPLYMSPEQVQAKAVDARSDIYSFGATCYHLLAGQPPFKGDTAFAIALQHVQAQPAPLHTLRTDLPAEFCAVVDKMMAKYPADRYQNGREVLRELNRLRDNMSATLRLPAAAAGGAPPTAPTPTAQTAVTLTDTAQPVRRRRLPGLAVASLLLALLAGAALAWGKNRWAAAAPTGPISFEPLLPSEEERFLRKEAELHAAPGKGPAQDERGLRAQLELGLFFLNHGRWDEAEKHFQSLAGQRQAANRNLGRVGRAIVLAFRDSAQESDELFVAFDNELRDAEKQPKKNLARRLQMLNDPAIREWIARALDRNAANCQETTTPFPVGLQRLRKPGPLLPRLDEKPADKNTTKAGGK